MYYLLIDSKSEEEKEFRIDLWNKHGMRENIGMNKLLT